MLGETLPGSCGDLPKRSDDALVVAALKQERPQGERSEREGTTGCREAGCPDASLTIRTIG